MPASRATIDIPLLLPIDPAERSRRLQHFLGHLRAEPGVVRADIDERTEQPILHIALNAHQSSLATVERLAHHAGVELRSRWGQAVWRIDGMVSPQSERAIESALADLPGVRASASFPSRTLRIEFDRAQCQLPNISMRLARLGFKVRPAEKAPEPQPPLTLRAHEFLARALEWTRGHVELSAAILGAVLLFAGFIAEQAGAPPVSALPVYIAASVIAGWFTFRDTILSLSRFRFSIDVLMFVAAIGAGLLGHMAEGALLLVLFAFGHAGEDLAMERARRAIQALQDIAPDTALRRNPSTGAAETVRVEDLEPGDVVLVRPGDRVPADGAVVTGVSAIDHAAITGESTPVEVSAGASVYAGGVNGDGAIDVRVERVFRESTLARAIRLVEEAQTRKGPTELFTTRVERYYVPLVLVATAALLLGGPLLIDEPSFESWKTWFYRSMAFLTAASPCALAIGAPAATLSALARSARMGVLIKGGAHLESLGRVRAIALDKTGTLTIGRPTVVQIRPAQGVAETDLLAAAAAVEASSAHPLAHAVVEAARQRDLDYRPADDVEQIVGKGLRGSIGGALVEIGGPRLFGDDPAAADILRSMSALAESGATAVAVRRDGQFLGLLALADEPREGAREAIADLHDAGVTSVAMLTGDNEHVARAVARDLGIDEVHASLLPEDKLRIVEKMGESRVVAMLGDGVNDAPAMAAADVGVAMGAAGSHVALETADVALLHDDLRRLPDVLRLARFARAIIFENLLLALGVIAVLAPIAAMGYATIGWAVVFHEGSTVVVVLNALRLLAFQPPRRAPKPA